MISFLSLDPPTETPTRYVAVEQISCIIQVDTSGCTVELISGTRINTPLTPAEVIERLDRALKALAADRRLRELPVYAAYAPSLGPRYRED